MTAEIAILNRTAVALAADSVVTIRGPTGRKMYDSAEKIFQISLEQPLALMIYNNPLHVNAPLEVVVRNFRKTPSTTFTKVCDVWPAFRDFLISDGHGDEDEFDHLRFLVTAEANRLSTVYLNAISEDLFRRRRRGAATLTELVRGALRARMSEAEAARVSGFLEDKTETEFVERYGRVIDEIAEVTLGGIGLGPEFRGQLHALIFALVRSSIKTEAFTGFVVAGFGTSDSFPTLHAVECDGIYFGRFRIVKESVTEIDRRGTTSAVIPFAQTDMAERFIFGIDTSAESELEKIVTSMFTETLASRPRAFPAAKRAELKEAARSRFREGVKGLKDASAGDLKGVVDHLSKKELSDIAFSLVELTSRKRRYSIDPETVGGPIDVAILTLNEGFIWVRRKHYFDTELNPRYAKRIREQEPSHAGRR